MAQNPKIRFEELEFTLALLQLDFQEDL